MLVRTPLPMATESLLGFVLRLSEQNGYDTPWRALSLAKIPRRQALSLDFPVEQLVPLLKCSPGSLDSISYSTRNASGEISYKILKTGLGSRIRKGTFRLATPAFCPACVHEKGFIEAHWDIRLVSCCSKHQCALLSHCPCCLQSISWFRPGLLTCTCGTTWNSASLKTAPLPLVAINELVTAKILGQEASKGITTGVPKELMALPGRSVLAVLGMLSDVLQHKASDNASPASVELLFYQWPYGYLNFLDSLTWTGRMSSLAKTIQRSGLPAEVMKLLIHPVQERLPPLPIKKTRAVARPIKHHRLRQIETTRDSLGDRQAAAILDIPVSTLNTMRAEGHFEVRHQATPRSAYHRHDLEKFRATFLNAATGESQPLDNTLYMSLGTILRHWKFGCPKEKVNLLVAIGDGTLPSYMHGNSIGALSAIHLWKKDAEDYVAKIRQLDIRKGISAHGASKTLHCDLEVVVGLVRLGHLQLETTAATVRVTKESLAAFAQRFASLASLAGTKNTSSKRLLKACNDLSIDVLNIPRRRSGSQPFIRRNDIHRLSVTSSRKEQS